MTIQIGVAYFCLWGKKRLLTDLIALNKNTFDHSLRLFKYFLSVEIHSNLHFLEKYPCRQIIEKIFSSRIAFLKIKWVMAFKLEFGMHEMQCLPKCFNLLPDEETQILT